MELTACLISLKFRFKDFYKTDILFNLIGENPCNTTDFLVDAVVLCI